MRGLLLFALASVMTAILPGASSSNGPKICLPTDATCQPQGLPSLGGNSTGTSSSIDAGRFRVFIHKGELGNEIATKVKIALEARGFQVAAPDSESDKVGGPGVDFFFDDDLLGASVISQIVNAVIPEDLQKVAPRRQRVRNPQGFIGVWLGQPKPWSKSPPEVGHCVQQRVVPQPNAPQSRFTFLVRCYETATVCREARGTDENRKSPCTEVKGLTLTDWKPAPGGWYNSWYQYSETERPTPFPPLPN